MHFCQVMTLQTGNNALLCKVFPSSLAGPTLSWFHRITSNTVTSFYRLFEKSVTQYMFSVIKKLSITSLFCIRMGRSVFIRDFMKCFGVVILQLDAISLNTVLQAMKQVVRPNIQFIDSLSLYSPITINELF